MSYYKKNILLLILFLMFFSLFCHQAAFIRDPGMGKFPIVIGKPDIGDYEIIHHFEGVVTPEDIEYAEKIMTKQEYESHSTSEFAVFGHCHKLVKKYNADAIINFSCFFNMGAFTVIGDLIRLK